MTDKEAMQQYLVDEFLEDYRERRVTRRDALKLLTGVTGSLGIAGALLAACSPAPAPTAPPAPSATAAPPTATPRPANTAVPEDMRVAQNDPAVQAQEVSFANGGQTITGYLARPAAGSGPFPLVLICHENRGLSDHQKDVTRRFGKSGYVGLAVDLLSREGGTAKQDRNAIPGMINAGGPERHVGDFQAALAYAKTLPFVNKDRVGMIGFCLGGMVTWMMAAITPELKAIAPYYGGNPGNPQVLSNIKAEVLGVYGGLDERTNANIPAVEAALKEGNVTYQIKVYPGGTHQFLNDLRESPQFEYNPVAARQAWSDTLQLFDRRLKA